MGALKESFDHFYAYRDVESKIANCYIWSPMYPKAAGSPPVPRPFGWDPYVPYTDWDKRFQLCRIRIKPTHKDYFIEGDIIEIQDDSSVCCFYGRIIEKRDRMTSYIIDAWGWGDELMESIFANAYTGSKTSEILEGQIDSSNKSAYSGSIDATTITMDYDVKIPTHAYIDLARYMERGVFWRVPGYDGKCYFDKDITDVNLLPAEPLIYPAEYNFDKEDVGTTDNDISLIDSNTGNDSAHEAIIVASKSGHKKVIKFTAAGDNGKYWYWIYNNTNKISGTYECFMEYKDNGQGIHELRLYSEVPEIIIMIRFNAADNKLYVYHAATNTNVTAAADTMHHIKVAWDCTTDTHSVWLNEVAIVSDVAFYLSRTATTMNNTDFYLSNGGGVNSLEMYVDAFDESWASGYSAGRNITPWSNYSKGIRFIGKKSYNLGVTRAHVWGTVNSKEQVNKISSLTTEEQEKGSFPIFPYIDLSLTNYTEVNQLATALKNIFSTDTLFINIRVQGKGFLQWGKRVNFKWNIKSILPTADDYMIVEWIYDAKNDRYLRFIISNNTVFEREFVNIQKQLGRDIVANAQMIDSAQSESTADGTVIPGARHDKFVWRVPEPTADDFTQATLTDNVNTWTDIDLSSIVPVGTTSVLIKLYLKESVGDKYFQLRKNGQSGTYQCPTFYIQVANKPLGELPIVEVDSSRKIEFNTNLTPSSWTNINILVVGYWI